MIRFAAAAQVPAANAVLIGDGSVGVVVERGESFPGSADPAPPVKVLVLRAGPHSGSKRGEVVTLAHLETVLDLGPLTVQETVPSDWLTVTTK